MRGNISNVIGIIDSHGALHYEKLKLGVVMMHEDRWPTQTHKRWRFDVHEWSLSSSPLTDKLDLEEQDSVLALMRKILTPPEWFLEGEAWNAAGRPRGRNYDRFLKGYVRKSRK